MDITEQLREAIKNLDSLYNRVGEGEITFSEAGDILHTTVGYESIRAMKRALEKLEEE